MNGTNGMIELKILISEEHLKELIRDILKEETPTPPQQKIYLTPVETADLFGLKVKTFYNKVSSGEIPLSKYFPEGIGHPRYKKVEVDSILE